MPPIPERVQQFGWGLFSIIVAAAAMIAIGIPIGPIVLLCGIIALLFAFVYPYVVFGLLILLIPFSGVMVSIPLGSSGFAERAFGGSIDIALSDIVAGVLLSAWALKVIFLWVRRGDINWKPQFPLMIPMLGILAAHLLSILSPLSPDKVLVLKYTMRPVFFVYLAFVLLTVNLIRSPRRVRMALGVITATGLFSALVGLASFAVPHSGGIGAVPLPIFGTAVLGDNHNLLAEWLCFSAPATLALVFLSREPRTIRLLAYAAILQGIVALLTFARTAWIVVGLETICLFATIWREEAKRYASTVVIALVFLLPIGALMAKLSSSAEVASSTSTRLMLSQIAVNLWQQSPVFGVGAGMFYTYVSQTAIFAIEFGAALDSHGFLQKILAETGIVGMVALAVFVFVTIQHVRKSLKTLHHHSMAWRASLVIAIAAGGAFVYQLFNTDYWTGKLWFPIGLMIAMIPALKSHRAHGQTTEVSQRDG